MRTQNNVQKVNVFVMTESQAAATACRRALRLFREERDGDDVLQQCRFVIVELPMVIACSVTLRYDAALALAEALHLSRIALMPWHTPPQVNGFHHISFVRDSYARLLLSLEDVLQSVVSQEQCAFIDRKVRCWLC